MQIAIYGLGILGTFGLFVASLLHSSNKIAFLWVLFGTLVTYLLAFTLYWHDEVSIAKTMARQSGLRQSSLNLDSVSEDASKIRVSLGERGVTDGCDRVRLQKEPGERFQLAGYKPLKLYIIDGSLYADVAIYGGSELPPPNEPA
jgi:hypothetical protein